MFTSKKLLGVVVLLSVALTGCLGAIGGLNNSEDVAAVEALIADLAGEDFALSELLYSSDSADAAEFYAQLEDALDYFADSFEVSLAYETFIKEVEPLDIGTSFFLSRTLHKEVLLDYEPEWDLWEYEDNLSETMDYDDFEVFTSLLYALDFNYIAEFVDMTEYLKNSYEESELIAEVEFSDAVTNDAVIEVNGNAATWSQAYSVTSTIKTTDDQTLAGKYESILSFSLTKEPDWTITDVHIGIVIDEALPRGLDYYFW